MLATNLLHVMDAVEVPNLKTSAVRVTHHAVLCGLCVSCLHFLFSFIAFAGSNTVSEACTEEVYQFYVQRNTNINKNVPLGEAAVFVWWAWGMDASVAALGLPELGFANSNSMVSEESKVASFAGAAALSSRTQSSAQCSTSLSARTDQPEKIPCSGPLYPSDSSIVTIPASKNARSTVTTLIDTTTLV